MSTLSIANLLEVASGAPGRLTFFMEVSFTLRYAGDEPPPDYVQVPYSTCYSDVAEPVQRSGQILCINE